MSNSPKKSLTIDSDAVRQLASLLDETGLTEIEYETETLRLRVAKGGSYAPAYAAAPAPAAAAAPVAAAPAAGEDLSKHPGTVKAPMVGVAYMSPEPGAAPFVTTGQSVSEGQTIMLIEAMKTFNPVKAHRTGKLTLIIQDAQPVEYGEPLAVIE